jgi:hypothetical protein
MATLELAIDATKAQQGAQVAQQAFTQVQKAAEGAARSIQVSNQAVSSAFQATGGTVQVAGGITATAKALADLNIAAASSNAARLLLEIGKTAQDFKEVAAGVQQVTTSYDIYGTKITTVTQATSRFGAVFATLNGIIKANPLLAAATAISAIGTALSLFSSKTEQATDAYRGFTEELAKTRISDQAAAILGIQGPGAGRRAGALQQAAEFTAAWHGVAGRAVPAAAGRRTAAAVGAAVPGDRRHDPHGSERARPRAVRPRPAWRHRADAAADGSVAEAAVPDQPEAA